MCSWRCQRSSTISMLWTAFWVPVSSNSNNSMLPTSFLFLWFWTTWLYAWYFAVDLVEVRVDLYVSQFFWINSRTLVLCAYFTTECGSLGIRKSMSASFTIIDSWLTSWSAAGLSVLSRSVLSPTLNVPLSWKERVFELSGTFLWSLRSFMCHSNFGILTVFKWTCLDYTRFNHRSHRSFWRNRFFVKRINTISWERDVFLPSCTVLLSSLKTGLQVLSRFGFRVGWFDWKLLHSCPTSDRWACSEPNSVLHSCFKEIFGRGRGDM